MMLLCMVCSNIAHAIDVGESGYSTGKDRFTFLKTCITSADFQSFGILRSLVNSWKGLDSPGANLTETSLISLVGSSSGSAALCGMFWRSFSTQLAMT